MNTRRLVVLLLAAGAAGVFALMVRGLVGGGSKQPEAKLAPPEPISQVLVAATRIDPGRVIAPDAVRWESWPTKAVDATFIRKSPSMNASSIVAGRVARAPMVPGEPVTFGKMVKSQSAGFMAATIAFGMRAISIPVSTAAVAGGFILPNNRVDIILTQVEGYAAKRSTTRLVVADVRVVAIDQMADKPDQKPAADIKTVTLEVTPEQARAVAAAQATGTLSLTLRSLGDDQAVAAKPGKSADDDDDQSGMVTVIRYGKMARSGGGPQ